MKQFNEWLQDELRVRGLKPADLAKASGLVPSTISRILSGQTKPSDETYIKIARALGEPSEKMLRLVGRLPPVDRSNTIEQDLLYSFRSLSEDQKQFLLDMLRGFQGQPPFTFEPPQPDMDAIIPDSLSPDIEAIIEIIARLDILERRLVYDYSCWRLTEQEQRRNSSGRRRKSTKARQEELDRVMEHLDLMISLDESDPLMGQWVIARLWKIINGLQSAEAQNTEAGPPLATQSPD